MDSVSEAVNAANVVVIGAAGQTGRPVVEALAARGARVRAVVHRDTQAGLVPRAAEAVPVELADTEALAEALSDAAAAYYIPPVFHPHEVRLGANVIAAAERAGLPRLVYHSVLHAPTRAMPHHWRKSQVEAALRDSALRWTILQPAMYAQTPLAFLDRTRHTLRIGFDPTRPFTPIDLADLAVVIADVLLSPGHDFATYELAGAEQLSYADMAQAMSRAWGHPVRVQRFPSAIAAMAASGRFGPRGVRPLKAMLDHYDAHGLIGNANVMGMLLEREPRTFAEMLEALPSRA